MTDDQERALIVALIEKIDAKEKKEQNFPDQRAFIEDENQFVAAQCGRRAGKTTALAERFIKTMGKHPGSLSRYIALTRDSAKDIMWPILQELDDKYNLEAEFTETNLTMTLPNGAKLKLMGADMQNFIRRLRGAKSPAVAIDEAQDFGDHLQSLVNDVLTPSIADYKDSWLAMTGTPGPIPRGYFYDVTHGGIGGYSNHKWTIFDNPHMPNAKAFVEQLKARNQWEDNNPTYLREYRNQWVLDVESLLIKYDEKINHYEQLPIAKWNYILGVDIGFKDSDALAVLGWSESQPNIYLVEEAVTGNQDITSLVDQINRLQKLYDISKIVMDTGGLGKKVAEEIIRRHHIPVQAADKARKFENVSFLNDWLRQRRFYAKSTSRFAQDSFQLQIDYEKTTPDRLIVKKGFHSDIIDAVLYAFKESPAFTYQTPKAIHKYGSDGWASEEVSRMEQAAMEHFETLEDANKAYNDWT